MKRLRARAQKVKPLPSAVIFFLIIFTGCATKEAVKSVSEEEVIRDRVMTYWNHKIKGEFDESYSFEDPFYRKTVGKIKYIQSFGAQRGAWLQAAISGLEIDDGTAKVDMKLQIRLPVTSSKSIETDVVLNEKWVKVDGIWYHVPQQFQRGGISGN